MDSEPEVTSWQLPLVEKAFADFRSLTRSYLRGEIQYEAFEKLAGVLSLRYDTEVATHKLRAQEALNAESGSSGAGRHRINEPAYIWPDIDITPRDESGNPLTFCDDPDCDGHGPDN